MKIENSLYYHSKVYLYTVYFSPLGEYRDEVIRIFGNRWQNGKRCLGINEEYSKYIVDNNHSSIFIIVHEKDTMDYASASLSIENRCFDETEEPQVFVMELCRHGEKTSVISPVKALFEVAEHVVKQKLNTKYLYLNPQPGEGFDRLIDIYTKYGFKKTFCPKVKYYTMRKKISKRRTKRK
jgi:hypothetical protein